MRLLMLSGLVLIELLPQAMACSLTGPLPTEEEEAKRIGKAV
jgi:hypothetical protein